MRLYNKIFLQFQFLIGISNIEFITKVNDKINDCFNSLQVSLIFSYLCIKYITYIQFQFLIGISNMQPRTIVQYVLYQFQFLIGISNILPVEKVEEVIKCFNSLQVSLISYSFTLDDLNKKFQFLIGISNIKIIIEKVEIGMYGFNSLQVSLILFILLSNLFLLTEFQFLIGISNIIQSAPSNPR